MYLPRQAVIIEQSHICYRKLPRNLTKKDEWLFLRDTQITIPSSFVVKHKSVRVSNATLSHILGLGLGPIFSRSSAAGRRAKLLLNINSVTAQLLGAKGIDRGTWVIDDWSSGYFHWLTDVLSRIELGAKSLSNYPILLPLQFSKICFIEETIKALDIPVIYIDPHSRYEVGELILTSYAAPTGNYNRNLLLGIIERLRDATYRKRGDHSRSFKNRRVYISRAKSYRRKVQNEAEIVPLLKKLEFEIVYPEEMSLTDQIILFSSASILVGLHGGGLTNMLFMKPGGIIFELRRVNDDHNNCYFSLASVLNLDYFYLKCESLGQNLFNDDCYVEPSQFGSLISQICKLQDYG